MPASEAQIRANQANSARSTGPRTSEGKERSRANSYHHGLTGGGVVLSREDAAEVERLDRVLQADLKPPGKAGEILVRRMAVLAVRMERSVSHECAAIAERVRKVMDEFEAPEGVDAETAERLRVEAGKIATFDASKPACLARKYEAAAERNFYRALKELRELKKHQATAASGPIAAGPAPVTPGDLASFLRLEAEIDRLAASLPKATPRAPESRFPADFLASGGRGEVPFRVGKAR